ncbi:hypothetical protein AB0D11_43895 [Streptomyces monashensis]|uniref:hypothetical protein n=1 Tax=Streptomyces monashensis TaxID=1678012 RepID=UPI0033C6B7F0
MKRRLWHQLSSTDRDALVTALEEGYRLSPWPSHQPCVIGPRLARMHAECVHVAGEIDPRGPWPTNPDRPGRMGRATILYYDYEMLTANWQAVVLDRLTHATEGTQRMLRALTHYQPAPAEERPARTERPRHSDPLTTLRWPGGNKRPSTRLLPGTGHRLALTRNEIFVYEMRPATVNDHQAVRSLLRARDGWAHRRRLLPADSIALRVLIEHAGDDMTLMLLTQDSDVAGCVALYATTPGWSWTANERAEPSMSLAMMHTHPDQHGAGLAGLTTLWVLDYTARHTSPELEWVRCSVPDNRLALYFREELGWHQVRVTHTTQGQRYAQLQQPPRPVPGLSALIRSTDPPLLVTGDLAITTTPVAPRQPRRTSVIATRDQDGSRP